MIDRGRHNILGVLIDAVDYEVVVSRIIDAAKAKQSLGVTALAVHGVMTGAMDDTHRHRLNHLDVVVPDGQPVRWALNVLYRSKLRDRVYGPTLMAKVCARAEKDGLAICLFGGDETLLDGLRASLESRFPRLDVACARPSAFRQIAPDEKDELVQHIRNSGAEIVFVGLGCPRQEVFVYECCTDLKMPCVAVGAAFTFHAGVIPQAPAWMQRSGLEWCFRLAEEPSRLWKRYVLLNPLYVALLLLQMVGLRCPDVTDTTEPGKDMLYG